MKNVLILSLFLLFFLSCVKLIPQEESTPRDNASLRLTAEARQYLEEGKTENAIRALEQAISLDPDNGQSYYYLAEAWLIKGKPPEAKKYNHFAEVYLKGNHAWMMRVERQADRINKLGQ